MGRVRRDGQVWRLGVPLYEARTCVRACVRAVVPGCVLGPYCYRAMEYLYVNVRTELPLYLCTCVLVLTEGSGAVLRDGGVSAGGPRRN